MLFRAHLLSPCEPVRLREIADGALVVDPAGRITAAGPFPDVAAAHPAEPVQDLRPHWILPGLVDLHSHLPQYQAVAMDGQELLPWLRDFIFPAEIRFADPDWAAAAAPHLFHPTSWPWAPPLHCGRLRLGAPGGHRPGPSRRPTGPGSG